jgi:hypothetical protein
VIYLNGIAQSDLLEGGMYKIAYHGLKWFLLLEIVCHGLNGLEWFGMHWNGLEWYEIVCICFNGVERFEMIWNGVRSFGRIGNGLGLIMYSELLYEIA